MVWRLIPMDNLVPSQLYITEASESKRKSEQELTVVDPEQTLESILASKEKNADTTESYGRTSS